jgi:hypothetical protein
MMFLIIATLILPASCSRETADLKSKSNRYLELLNLIPANENTLKRAYVQDLAYLAEKTQQYPQVTDKYAIAHSHHLSGYSSYYDEEEWQQTLGFTRKDVEKNVLAGTTPPLMNYQAVHVNVDRDSIAHAVRTGPLNDILKVAAYNGVEYYSWGEDNQIDLSRMSMVRPLGIGYRLVYINGFVFWTAWTDGIKEMIDAYSDRIDSLADIQDYQLLAQGLAKLDVCNAFFSMQSQSQSEAMKWQQNYFGPLENNPDPSFSEQRRRFLEAVEGSSLLEPYLAYATGAGIDERGYYMVIVLLNPDKATAKSNATLLEKRVRETKEVWRGYDWLEKIESTDIKSQGQLTLAKLYGEVVESWSCPDMYDDEPYEPLLVYK